MVIATGAIALDPAHRRAARARPAWPESRVDRPHAGPAASRRSPAADQPGCSRRAS